jgi:hypothetical protein
VFTALAYADEESALWPVLAFFTWAFLLSRLVIELPSALGLLPRPGQQPTDDPDGGGGDTHEIRYLDEDRDDEP